MEAKQAQIANLEEELKKAASVQDAAAKEQQALSTELAEAQIKCAGLSSEVGRLKASQDRASSNLNRRTDDLEGQLEAATVATKAAEKAANERSKALSEEVAKRAEAEQNFSDLQKASSFTSSFTSSRFCYYVSKNLPSDQGSAPLCLVFPRK